MKKILFISNPMNRGGIEKALLSIMQELDFSRYSVWFMPYTNEKGAWNCKIPKQINLLQPPEYLETMFMYRKNIKKTLIWGITHPMGLFYYVLCIIYGTKKKNMDVARQLFWKKYQSFLPCVEEKFDLAIDFRSEIGCYFMIDKINADKKISWYHGVYDNYDRDKKIDEYYWKKLDGMVAISLEGKENLIKNFAFLKEKVFFLKNFLPIEEIKRLSERSIDGLDVNKTGIVSVGRLDCQKNYTLAIDVAKILKEKGVQFIWWIIGDGDQFKILKEKIRNLNLENEVVMVGASDNPYPYMKKSKFFIHTSMIEGRPIVLDEAKLLDDIIITTPFSTASNQVLDEVNGKISTFEADDIADEIIRINNDETLQSYFLNNIEKEKKDLENDYKTLNCILQI